MHAATQRVLVDRIYPIGVGGDLIAEVDGEKITGRDTLQSAMNRKRGGDTLNLTIYRNGKSMKVQVRLGSAPTVL